MTTIIVMRTPRSHCVEKTLFSVLRLVGGLTRIPQLPQRLPVLPLLLLLAIGRGLALTPGSAELDAS